LWIDAEKRINNVGSRASAEKFPGGQPKKIENSTFKPLPGERGNEKKTEKYQKKAEKYHY